MTKNGISTTTAPGSEQYEEFTIPRRGKKSLVRYQYDYRHTDGELFSIIKPTLDECRTARDKWLIEKSVK